MRGERQPARHDARAELLGLGQRGVEAGTHAWLDATLGAEQLLGHAQPHALQVFARWQR